MNNINQNGEKEIKDVPAALINSSMSIDESILVNEKDEHAKDFRLIISHENLLNELEQLQKMKEKMQKLEQMEVYLQKIENQEREIQDLKSLVQSILI